MARRPPSKRTSGLLPPPIPGERRDAEAAARRGRLARKVFVIVALMALAGVVVLPTTLVLLAGLVPTFAAFLSSREEGVYRGLTVGFVNMAGILPLLLTLWGNSHTVGQATFLLADPLNWLMMYGAAGIGWLVFYTVPPGVLAVMRWRYQMEIRQHRKTQQDLIGEWGKDVEVRVSQADGIDA